MSEPTTREVIDGIRAIQSSYMLTSRQCDITDAAISKLESLAAAEDARPEQDWFDEPPPNVRMDGRSRPEQPEPMDVVLRHYAKLASKGARDADAALMGDFALVARAEFDDLKRRVEACERGE